VTVKSVAAAWNRFFFQPVSPVPIALFRVSISLVLLVDLALWRHDWLTWFGPRGLVTLPTMQQIEPGPRINVFALLPQTEFWSNAVFWCLLTAVVLLLAGWFTRASSVAVFVLVASLHQRNLFITNSGDTLTRVSLFFLMFAPAGAALSVDRLVRIWRGKERAEVRPQAPWAQRMIQIELALLYLMTFWNKSQGPAWVDGTALYYVYHLDQFRRFPLPGFLLDPLMVKLQTWFTLAVEFALGVLVWFRDLRYYVLGLGVLLHLGLEYSMNVPMFQWTALAFYVTFVDEADLARVWERVRGRLPGRMREPVAVFAESRRAGDVLAALDVFGRARVVSRAADAAMVVRGAGDLAGAALKVWVGAGSSRGNSTSAAAKAPSRVGAGGQLR